MPVPEAISIALEVGAEDARVLTVTLAADEDHAEAQAEGWQLRISAKDETAGIRAFQVQVTHEGSHPQDLGIVVRWELGCRRPPEWMIPGMFYGENRTQESARLYPRFVADPEAARDDWSSSYWAFRSDRTPLPAVMARTSDPSRQVGLATRAAVQGDLSGVGFGFDRKVGQAWIGLNFPYIEEPMAYTTNVRAPCRERSQFHLEPEETVTVQFWSFIGESDPHSYDPFIRFLYQRFRAEAPLNPWMGVEKAAELGAYGLFRWHYDADDRALYETMAFDREGYDGDRRHMHVGWVSGVPHAYALLAHGYRVGKKEYVNAARAVIDHIVEATAPAGILWGEWRKETGFGPGWTNQPGAIHTRTIGEALWFLLRALELEEAHGLLHPRWEAVGLAHLQYLAKIQRADGSLGTYYDSDDVQGKVLRWEGSGGLIWIPFLLLAARRWAESEWMDRAIAAGRYYEPSVRAGYLFGAPEDVDMSPTSEDGYNAIIAYVHLYEEQCGQEESWLDLAKLSANWTMTFRFVENLRFSPETLLGAYDFRTRGADLASPANNHLHSYGLIALPEMLRLAEYANDDYYRQRTQDNLACFLQLIARRDGDFNAQRGMVSERYYQTDWAQAKGKLLGLSHAWCIGLLLYACEHLLDQGIELVAQDGLLASNRA